MIDTSSEGRIKIFRMSHGPANAMDLPFLTAIADAFKPDDSFDGVVLTGNGRFFSAGLNIVALAGGDENSALEIVETLGRAVTNIMTFPGPVIDWRWCGSASRRNGSSRSPHSAGSIHRKRRSAWEC